MSFNDLKKRDAQAELERLNKESEKLSGGGFQRDPRYWRPLLDGQGSGNAVIRFLPAMEGETIPYVKRCSYGFKGPGGRWYIKDSPLTLGLPDPVAELNTRDWNTGTEEGKARARGRRMRRFFTSNVYIVDHPARREDEGKVFLFNYGTTIFDMLKEKRSPSKPGRQGYNPFDFWKGANFQLDVRKKAGFPNYDDSEFDMPGPLAPDDAELKRIYESQYSLKAEVAPEKFDSYEDLKRKLEEVLGETVAVSSGGTLPPEHTAAAQAASASPLFADDDDGLAYFQNLAEKVGAA